MFCNVNSGKAVTCDRKYIQAIYISIKGQTTFQSVPLPTDILDS